MRTKRFLFNFTILFTQYMGFLLLMIQHISASSPMHNAAVFITYACITLALHAVFSYVNFTFGVITLHKLTKHNLSYAGDKKQVTKYGLFYFIYLKFTNDYINLYLFLSNEKIK